MVDENIYRLQIPEEVSVELGAKMRQLRLRRKWKQSTLAERSGVSVASLRRFERTGLVSLQSLLKLSCTLGRLDDFDLLLAPPKANSIYELEDLSGPLKTKRGVE